MPILSAAILVQLAAACPAAGVPSARIVAHAQVESSFQSTAIHDNATGKSYAPATVEDAVTLARSLLAQRHRIDAGIMQITDANWSWLGLTVETVFDPQRNVCAGQAVLAEAYRIERAVSCRYNSGKPVCGDAYPNKVDAAMGRVEPMAPPPVPVTVLSRPAPTGRPPAWDVYASVRPTRETQLAGKN